MKEDHYSIDLLIYKNKGKFKIILCSIEPTSHAMKFLKRVIEHRLSDPKMLENLFSFMLERLTMDATFLINEV